MKALFLARLQPMHLGHLHAVKSAMKKFDEVIIAIGSSDKHNTFKDPFSFEERKTMVEKYFGNCKTIGIEDMESDDEWVKIIRKKADFDVIISGSEWVKKCFSGSKKVVQPDFLIPEIYNGTKIREKMAKGEKWVDLVPEKVAKYIKKIKGVERIKNLKLRQV